MKKGKYFIGDPCYVIEEWDDFLSDYLFKESGEEGTFQDKNVWANNTSYGDGLYNDNVGNNYPVDSGTIGVIPLEICNVTEKEIEEKELGSVVNFKKNFSPFYEEGFFYIENIIIDTIQEEDDDEEY